MTRWVVVGGGSAGCVVASRLSEDPETEVVLVEAGEAGHADRGDDFLVALGAEGRTFADLTAVRVEGRPAAPYRQGRGLGGSSAVNAMIAVPGGPVRAPHLLPLEVPAEHELGAVDRALLAAAPDAAPVALTRRHGVRVSAAAAYLDPVKDRPNLRLVTGTTVRKVLVDRRRAVGVLLEDGAELTADRVVLAAGAVHSPVILLRSGVDAPGVGEGLQDHPSAPIALTLRAGAVARPGSLAVASLLQRDAVQVLPMNHLGVASPGLGLLMPALMRVASRGRVRLGDDPDGPPVVELRMLSHPADLEGMVRAVSTALDLLGHPAFDAIVEAAHVDEHGTTAASLGDADRIRSWLPDHVGDYVHPSCTCAMGRVVDDHGRVLGYDGLYVCDASVFERIPEVNTNLPTVMLAEVLARRWRAG